MNDFDTDLQSRLHRAASRIDPGPPPVAAITRTERRRRTRRTSLGVALAVATVVIGTALVFQPGNDSIPAPATPPTQTPPKQDEDHSPHQVTDADVDLAQRFVALALGPSAMTVSDVPFANEVQYGLSTDLTRTLSGTALGDFAAWTITSESFRGYVGDFNPLERIRWHAEQAGGSRAARSGAEFVVQVGPHPHCASPAVPAPEGFDAHRRISIQPDEAHFTSCLEWSTVDLFVNDEGLVEAVTLDAYEP